MVMVLLVDNDGAQLAESANALLAAGHQVCTAVSGQEALEELDWNQPDALVCASGLPVVDGWELVRQVREDSRHRSLPIVFIGRADDKELRLAAFRNGVDDYLPNPFDPEELVRRLDRVLGRSRLVERPAFTSQACDVQGRIENFPLASVMRLLATERKTGVLVANRKGERVRVLFRQGEPVRADTGHDLTIGWQESLMSALSWSAGDFWFAEQSVSDEDEIQLSVRELLEGALHNLRFGRRA